MFDDTIRFWLILWSLLCRNRNDATLQNAQHVGAGVIEAALQGSLLSGVRLYQHPGNSVFLLADVENADVPYKGFSHYLEVHPVSGLNFMLLNYAA